MVPYYKRAAIYLIIILTLFRCAPGLTPIRSHKQEPIWTKELPETKDILYFRGVATHKSRLEEGLNDAFANGVQQIVELLGIKGERKYDRERSEQGIVIHDYIHMSARAEVKGVREVDNYWEKHAEEDKEKVDYYWNVWVLLSWPKEEYEKTKTEIEDYISEVSRIASSRYEAGKRHEETGKTIEAYGDYNEVKRLLKEIPENREVELRSNVRVALKRLESSDNPELHLVNLKNTGNFLGEIKPMTSEEKVLKVPSGVKVGDHLKIKIEVKQPSYIYVIGYDKTNSLVYMLYPNRYETNNFVGLSGFICPSGEDMWITAIRPLGYNFVKIIATSNRVMEFNFSKSDFNTGVIEFSDDQLQEFLVNLESSPRWDSKLLEFWIEE